MTTTHKPRIGLALGGGSARGWAHIGVIRTLAEAGVVPDMVCGTSVGAFVGAAYVDGDLDRLEQWARSLKLQAVVGFLDFSLGGGLIKGEKLIEFFRSHFVDIPISELPLPFATVATDLQSGREIWLQAGMVSEAVRASIALPGLFTPVEHEGRWLVDGGLVNPVPVSLCRAMGADLVIAVDLNSDIVGKHLRKARAAETAPDHAGSVGETMLARIQSGMATLGITSSNAPDNRPSMLDVLASGINIMQQRITRSRLAGDPADVLIAPRLAEFGLMEFHRAAIAIETGSRAAKQALPQINAILEYWR
jgi:NTE family protein